MAGGEKAPWMPFYGFDFFGDGLVRRMKRETRCLYLELLWHAWNEGGIPTDPDEIACVVDMEPEAFACHWSRIAPAWQPHPSRPELLVQSRQELLREHKDQVRAKRREAGRMGGRAAQRKRGQGSESSNDEASDRQMLDQMGEHRA